jgi:3-methyladenine DNA glycosylase AlkD
MKRDILIARLGSEAEEQYRIFNQKFVLTNRNVMLGVKVPKMRGIAREIACGDWKGFLEGYGFCGAGEQCRNIFFEEVMIIGMVIDLVNVGPELRLQLVGQFVPLIDNWAVCDVFCGGAKWVGEPGRGPKSCNRVPLKTVWGFLQQYLGSNKEFEIRFGVVMLMSYFLRGEYIGKVFEALEKVQKGDYYVDMAVAWCLATAKVNFDAQTEEFVGKGTLPPGVVKKFRQKVRDSLRLRSPLVQQQKGNSLK